MADEALKGNGGVWMRDHNGQSIQVVATIECSVCHNFVDLKDYRWRGQGKKGKKQDPADGRCKKCMYREKWIRDKRDIGLDRLREIRRVAAIKWRALHPEARKASDRKNHQKQRSTPEGLAKYNDYHKQYRINNRARRLKYQREYSAKKRLEKKIQHEALPSEAGQGVER